MELINYKHYTAVIKCLEQLNLGLQGKHYALQNRLIELEKTKHPDISTQYFIAKHRESKLDVLEEILFNENSINSIMDSIINTGYFGIDVDPFSRPKLYAELAALKTEDKVIINSDVQKQTPNKSQEEHSNLENGINMTTTTQATNNLKELHLRCDEDKYRNFRIQTVKHTDELKDKVYLKLLMGSNFTRWITKCEETRLVLSWTSIRIFRSRFTESRYQIIKFLNGNLEEILDKNFMLITLNAYVNLKKLYLFLFLVFK